MDDSGWDIQTSRIPPINLNLESLKKELLIKTRECQERGLTQSFKWLAEILHALRGIKLTGENLPSLASPNEDDYEDVETYLMSKSYFDLKEYDRCNFFTANCKKSPRAKFLHYYSAYMSGEKKRLDNMQGSALSSAQPPSSGEDSPQQQAKYLKDLKSELQNLYEKKELDGYTMYLYGIVLKKTLLMDQAKEVLLEAIRMEPCLWGAWLELAHHINDRDTLDSLDLPDHWIKYMFVAHAYVELHLNQQALEIYFGLQSGGLSESTYLLAQIAIAYHNMRQVTEAVEKFQQLLSGIDPYRLDNLDIYSNLLYVNEQRVELAHLAHKSVEIDKYRTETCCVIGNYYSLRRQHGKAVLYFQRALKLNPNYLSAWTLMGHEYMELKNTRAAIQSYRHAIEVNKRDYRAWYGLGQTYEMLKLHFYCLYYYKRAQELRPHDSRMLVALGECYERMDRQVDAMKCYWKAHNVGDMEGGIALFQLAKMYEHVGEVDQAASAYHQYIVDTEDQGIADRDQQSRAYKYLAQYFVKQAMWDQAYIHAQKCTEFINTREEGKALIKEIALKRIEFKSVGGNGNGGMDDKDSAATGGDVNTDEPKQQARPIERLRSVAANEAYNGSSPNFGGNSGVGAGGGAAGAEDSPRREIEPVNLTFTP